MTWTLFTILLLFSLAGTARIGLFVLNRAVFGQKTEGDQMKWAMIIIPPVLFVLTFLDYPLVCGHTRGGQIRLPFFGAVVVPSKHEARNAAGFFHQDNLLMYVSRGLGSVPPIRILCPPELPFSS